MKIQRPLWKLGERLRPQHFQLEDAYHEALLEARIAHVSGFAWGVVDLELDARRIAAGEVAVHRLEAVLPGGLVLDVAPDGESAIAARNLAATVPNGTTVDILVGVAKADAQGANVDAIGGARSTRRFVEAIATVRDFNTGDAPLDVAWARPNPTLLLSTERFDGFDVLPIARVHRAPSGAFSFDARFIPPAIRVSASEALGSGLRRVVQALLQHRTRLLAGRKRGRDLDGPGALHYWLLTIVQEKLPLLVDAIERPSAHPRDAYLALVELEGALSLFDPEDVATSRGMPRYEHLRLAETFHPLVESILRVLQSLSSERFVRVPMRRHDAMLYYTELTEPALLRNVFFVAASGAPEPVLREQLPRMLKVATWEEMGALVASSTSGARATLDFRPPDVLPVKPGMVFIRIDPTTPQWQSIVRRGNLCLHQPVQPDAISLELFAVDPSVSG